MEGLIKLMIDGLSAATSVAEVAFNKSDISKEQMITRFEKIHEPIFRNFEGIHSDYVIMFSKAVDQLPSHLDNGLTAYISNNKDSEVKIGDAEYLKRIEEVRSELEKDRIRNHSLRINARASSSSILERAQTILEKRFLWSILNYFIDGNTPLKDDEFVDKIIIAGIIERGYEKILDSPSTLIVDQISNTDNAEVMRTLIKETQRKLLLYNFQITKHFFALKDSAYS